MCVPCCGSRPVVVLADREKEEMDDELRHSLKGYNIEWHTRSGAPHCSSDLDRVAAGQAKNVILLDNNVEVGPFAYRSPKLHGHVSSLKTIQLLFDRT